MSKAIKQDTSSPSTGYQQDLAQQRADCDQIEGDCCSPGMIEEETTSQDAHSLSLDCPR